MSIFERVTNKQALPGPLHDFSNANAWRYRDYVIKSFNQDKPYNRFLVEQLAGDELDEPGYDRLIATTYYRIGPRVRYREKDNPYYRYEYLDDTIRTTFQGLMGLSVNCARCHNHKFDPITRQDYYRTMAMFFSQVDYDHPLAPADQVAAHKRLKQEVEAQIRPLLQQVFAIESPYRKAAFEKRLAKFLEKDPTNIYLWRFPLRRLEAEAIRDVILSASGQLNLQAGGEPFFPAIPKSVRDSYQQGKWVMTKEEPATWRRSIYAYWKRGLKYPLFEVHDQPDPNVTCEMRNTTTVPTQALTLLNNEFVLLQARHFAERVGARRAAIQRNRCAGSIASR